jgi:small subunit ribosomal protein S5
MGMSEDALQNQVPEVQDRVVHIGRVVKVVKGGRRFSFNALVVSGDGTGSIGYGLGKASEVPEAIRKGASAARKSVVNVTLVDGTLPYPINVKFGASKVMLHPAKKGVGIIAGGCVRAVMELAGVQDVVAKCHGSSNPHNLLKATFSGLTGLKSKNEILARRGMFVEEEVPESKEKTPETPVVENKDNKEDVK